MMRGRHSIAMALICAGSSMLMEPAKCVNVNMLLKADSADSWQDFFGPEAHIQARSLPHKHKKGKKNHTKHLN